MLTKAEIAASSATLDETDVEMWLALVRANAFYRGNKAFYPDVPGEIDNADGTVKGKMLNAILDRIEALGVGEVNIRNGDEGVNWSQSSERDALVKYALSVLYDATDVVYPVSGTGSFGDYQVRQRSAANACAYCSCIGYHHSWCSLSPWQIG